MNEVLAVRAREPLFILGAPNTPSGELSSISLLRIDRAIQVLGSGFGDAIMVTGGFGAHFNTSARSHRAIVHKHLAESGAALDPAEPGDLLSSNTVEDMVLIRGFLEGRGLARCGIVTSQFHARRCRYLISCLFEADTVTLFPADDPSDVDPAVVEHERNALTRMIEQGGVLVNGVVYPPRYPKRIGNRLSLPSTL